MQIDIGDLIAELLFRHKTVSIPGLGAFIKEDKPASIDQIMSKASPDRTELSFNSNLAIDDGVLLSFLKEKFALNYEEAKNTLTQYVQKINNALSKKEIIIFPAVGRLYKDFEGQLQFIPEETNFNKDSFGLPVVKISPVPQQKAIVKNTETVVKEKNFSFSGKWLKANWGAIAALVGFLIILLAFIFLYPRLLNKAENDPTANLPSSRLNVKPPPISENDISSEEIDTAQNIIETESEEDTRPDAESSTLAPDTKVCIIAIGLFSEKANVNKLTQKIIKAGYEPYVEKLRSSTRVGVQFMYSKDSEIEPHLERIKNDFAVDAFVLKR